MPLLYLIEILHQTTTYNILLYPLLELYLIEILHQTTTADSPQDRSFCCILSKFYIKPQHGSVNSISRFRCILSKFYIKPQRASFQLCCISRCILSKFYIKPQQPQAGATLAVVVSYRNSTSNHNDPSRLISSALLYLIEILHQTTTSIMDFWYRLLLYLIEILHQTTTEPV